MPLRRRAATSTTRRCARSTSDAQVPCEWLESTRAVVHPLHVGHDRQAEGRAARHRRLRGRAGGVDAPHLLRRAGRDDVHAPATSAGWSATRTSSTGRCIDGMTTIMYEGLPIRPDPAHLVEDRRGAQGHDDVQLADGDPRAEEAGSGVPEEARPVGAALPVPRRRAARRADGALGVRRARRGRSSTTTGRPKPAGRSCRRSPASRTRRASSAARRSRSTATTCAAARGARARRSAPARRACWRSCRRCRRAA